MTSDDFHNLIASQTTPVLVDFWAEWCAPCHKMAQTLDQVQREHETLTVVKINVDESPDIAAEYGVRSLPTVILFRDGVPTHRMVGAKPTAVLLRGFELA